MARVAGTCFTTVCNLRISERGAGHEISHTRRTCFARPWSPLAGLSGNHLHDAQENRRHWTDPGHQGRKANDSSSADSRGTGAGRRRGSADSWYEKKCIEYLNQSWEQEQINKEGLCCAMHWASSSSL